VDEIELATGLIYLNLNLLTTSVLFSLIIYLTPIAIRFRLFFIVIYLNSISAFIHYCLN